MQVSISKQEYLAHEKYCKNGEEREVHYVVKNNAFQIKLEMEGDTNVSFEDCEIISSLYYDSEDGNLRAVPLISCAPLLVETRTDPQTDEFHLVANCKISILSSQHENCHFIIRFTVIPTNEDPVIVDSAPINVVSKLHQIRKIVSRISAKNPSPLEKKIATLVEPRNAKRKREEDDEKVYSKDVLGVLKNISETQALQNEVLTKLLVSVQELSDGLKKMNQQIHCPDQLPTATRSSSLPATLPSRLDDAQIHDPNPFSKPLECSFSKEFMEEAVSSDYSSTTEGSTDNDEAESEDDALATGDRVPEHPEAGEQGPLAVKLHTANSNKRQRVCDENENSQNNKTRFGWNFYDGISSPANCGATPSSDMWSSLIMDSSILETVCM